MRLGRPKEIITRPELQMVAQGHPALPLLHRNVTERRNRLKQPEMTASVYVEK